VWTRKRCSWLGTTDPVYANWFLEIKARIWFRMYLRTEGWGDNAKVTRRGGWY